MSGRDQARRQRSERARDLRTGGDAVRARIDQQTRWVDLQIRQANERGEFDNLPGAGKPLGDLGAPHDRDWWLKKLVEREQITGVLPEALQLRKDDAELEDVLDCESAEPRVREVLEEFSQRVIEARRQLQGGPPVITPTRDVEAEVEAWQARRLARRAAAAVVPEPSSAPEASRRRWWRR